MSYQDKVAHLLYLRDNSVEGVICHPDIDMIYVPKPIPGIMKIDNLYSFKTNHVLDTSSCIIIEAKQGEFEKPTNEDAINHIKLMRHLVEGDIFICGNITMTNTEESV